MSNDRVSSEAIIKAERERRAHEAGAAGNALFAQGRFLEAARQFQEAVRLRPSDPDLHYNLACAAWGAGDLALTGSNLNQCIEIAPNFARAHDGLARLHHQLNDMQAAHRHSSIAVRLSPAEPEFLLTHAVVLESLGRFTESWDVVRPVLECDALSDRAASLCARLAPKLGRYETTAALLEAALGRPPAQPRFRRQLHFGASAFFEQMGRYDDAFAQARLAHGALPRPYDARARAREFERRIEYWTAARTAGLSRATHGSSRPLFIVGMPRSGTSLVEQVLGCHPAVFAAGELDAMNRTSLALDTLGLPYPRSLEELSVEQANRVAGVYLGELDSLNNSARYVTDKMPLNFIYLDLVQALLPGSRVIHCTRDPLDTCVSLYLTEFETPYDFAQDLGDLGEFYVLYRRLMEHWKSVLRLPILEVKYEDVVSDLEGQTRRMLEFLDLPWEERCLRFHESDRVVATASREQVRKRIYASSIGRWRKYQRHLGQLIAGLDVQFGGNVIRWMMRYAY